jgi:predicted porin
MPRSTFGGAGISDIFERFQNINFRRHDANVSLHTEYWKRATLDVNYAAGTRINYTPAAGMAPFLAHGSELQSTITLRPMARLKIDEIYYLARMCTAQSSVFINHQTRTRVNYQFTRALSLRMIVDYNAVLENAALIDLTRQKRITGDALMTYLIHPGTALYVGYTDRLENLALTNGTVLPVGFPSTTTARQLFAKVSYLFRF